MKFALIDTNIILDCALIRKRKHGSDLMEKLMAALTPSGIVLLVPQVVELELDAQWESALAELKGRVEAARENAEKATKEIKRLADLSGDSVGLPNEMDLAEAARKVIDTREKSRDIVKDEFQRLLSHPRVRKLPLTLAIQAACTNRAISGRAPSSAKQSGASPDYDSMIVETLIDFFKGLREHLGLHSPELELLLCSANTKHFGDGGRDPVIHRAISADFDRFGVQVHYYPSLTVLLDKGFKVEVDQDEVSRYQRAQRALEARQALGGSRWRAASVESKVAFFTYLMDVLDDTTQYLLGCAVLEPAPFTRESFEQAYPTIIAEKQRIALDDLCTAGLLTVEQGVYSATSLGREFLDEVTLSGCLLDYLAREPIRKRPASPWCRTLNVGYRA